MSTSTTDTNPSGSDLSTGAIVGIVIGSILGLIVLIGVVFLVRHFFCRFPGSQIPADKFKVSYIRSDLDSSTLDRNASSSTNPDGLGRSGRRDGGDTGMEPSVPTPSLKVGDNTQDVPDGSESFHGIQINLPESSNFSNQKFTTGESSLPSKSSKIGTDNPCFDSEDDKSNSLSTPTRLSIPTISISQPNSRNNSPTSSVLKLNTSYAQERGNLIRRSYHLDRNVASAIAAQRNRETTVEPSIFDGSQFPPDRNNDVIIVFTARTVL